MTKSQLKTGMIVTSRDGDRQIVFLDTCHKSDNNYLTNGSTWSSLAYYNEDLTSRHGDHFDIIKVERCNSHTDIFGKDSRVRTTIWERPESKKMTVAEIEAILGYKVEIISDQ